MAVRNDQNRRFMYRALTLFLPLLLTACAGATSDVVPVDISLRNVGQTPLACRLMFGHWVDRDLGELQPGAEVAFPVQQQGDGGLFVMRPDGGARMMIETIQCGIYPDWPASVGQVDFAPARQQKIRAISASCGEPTAGGRIVCPPVTLTAAE